MAEFKKEQEEFEKNNKGRCERIFPLAVKEAAATNRATQEDKKISSAEKELASQQYQALLRQ